MGKEVTGSVKKNEQSETAWHSVHVKGRNGRASVIPATAGIQRTGRGGLAARLCEHDVLRCIRIHDEKGVAYRWVAHQKPTVIVARIANPIPAAMISMLVIVPP